MQLLIPRPRAAPDCPRANKLTGKSNRLAAMNTTPNSLLLTDGQGVQVTSEKQISPTMMPQLIAASQGPILVATVCILLTVLYIWKQTRRPRDTGNTVQLSGSPKENVREAPVETGDENTRQTASTNNWENLESILRSRWEKLEMSLLTAVQTNMTNMEKTQQSHWEKMEATLQTTFQSNRRQLLAVQKEVDGLTEQVRGLHTLVTSESKGLRELMTAPQQQQQELREAIALQASMKAVVDGLKSQQDLLQDTHQSTLDARVEMKAEGDRVVSSLSDFEARFYAEINSLFRRLEDLSNKMDQTHYDLTWHAQEQYGKVYLLEQAAENSGLTLDNTRLLGEVSEETKEVLDSLKGMMEDLMSRLLPPASRPPQSQAHMPPPSHQANAPTPGGGGPGSPDPVPISLTTGLRFKSPPTSPPVAPAPQIFSPGSPLTLTAEDLGRILLILQQSQAMMLGR